MFTKNLVLEIDEIEKHLGTLGTDENKIKYLVYLRNEYFILCYNSNDRMIEMEISASVIKKYERIPYLEMPDNEQTHISHSEFILLLRHIDGVLLPYVKEELIKVDKNIKEDLGIMKKDYEVFNFDLDKVLNHSNGLKEDRVLYLEAVKKDFVQYLEMIHKDDYSCHLNNDLSCSSFLNEIDKRIISLKRYPNKVFPKLVQEEVINEYPELFKREPLLFEFDINRIKDYTKGLNNPIEQIRYMEFVKKEAKQNSNLFDEFEYLSFIHILDSEIEFYTKILKLPKMTSDNSTKIESAHKEIIKLHWQDDNSLVPYLIDLLHKEGLISKGDYENRKQFIEQTILKNNGEVFTVNEVSSYEHSFEYVNKKGGPRKRAKIDRVINEMKSKSLDIKAEKRKPKE
ncbi:MAG: hypothetical protein ACOYN6_12520 [Ignavibacteria bacterium]